MRSPPLTRSQTKDWDDLIAQKEADFKKAHGPTVPSFVIPQKSMPKPPAGSVRVVSPSRANLLPQSDSQAFKDCPELPPRAYGLSRRVTESSLHRPPQPIPTTNAPAPRGTLPQVPQRGMRGVGAIRGGTLGRSVPLTAPPSTWGEAPKPNQAIEGSSSFATTVLQRFPRVIFQDQESGLCIGVGTVCF